MGRRARITDPDLVHAPCPHCRQPVLTRHGVILSEFQATLFDAVAKAPTGGLTIARLCARLYRGWPEDAAKNALKANVWQINERFAATDIKIVNANQRGRGNTAFYILEGVKDANPIRAKR